MYDEFKPHYFLFAVVVVVVVVIHVAINRALQYTSQWLIYLLLFFEFAFNAKDQ